MLDNPTAVTGQVNEGNGSLFIYLFICLAVPVLSWGTRTLSCSLWDPVLQPGIEARTPALGA